MEEKLNALSSFLEEKGLKPKRNHKSHYGFYMDLKVTVNKYPIAVKISKGKEDDELFYQQSKKFFKPFFIRENETVEFIKEKMNNLVNELMALPTNKSRGMSIKKWQMLNSKITKNIEYAKQCEERHQQKLRRKEKIEKEKAEKQTKLEAQKAALPKPKRKRIVKYIKICNI